VSASELLERWRSDLESWAIPTEILAATPESPWVLPRQLFIRRAEHRSEASAGHSYQRAWEALANPGLVLDVGAGAGAACLPLVPRATAMTAVDSDRDLLSVLVDNADRLGKAVLPVCGRWPDVAGEVEPADVVTCHHVLYNVADLGPFVAALTSHARRLVVVELTARHPLTALNPLWERFHGLVRPNVPTACDALAVLEELGLAPGHEVWSRSGESDHGSFEDLVEVTRRRLCMGPGRAGEVASALRELGVEGDRAAELRSPGSELVTIWWSGRV
jgi:SAM-dependent methyltransferase